MERHLEMLAANLSLMCLLAAPSGLGWGCDRPSDLEKRAQEQWQRLAEDHGSIPEVQEGDPLDRPYPTLVLAEDGSLLEGASVSRVPSVMDVADAIEGSGDAGVATEWVVWAVTNVKVERLARAVEVLRLAAGGETDGGPIRIWLAVDGGLGDGDMSVRGIQLVPFENPELSASNAFAVHAPQETTVSDFLSKFLARRRESSNQGIEQMSK